MANSLTKKLNIRSGMKGVVMHPPDGFEDKLDLPDDVELKKRPGKDYDFVIAFETMLTGAMALMPKIQKTLKYDGLLWFCYPKKSSKMESDLSRDVLWEEMKFFSIEPVAMISIDDTWSAMRFRPDEMVKRKK